MEGEVPEGRRGSSLRALNGAHATSENSKQIRVLRKKTLCAPWLRGGIKFNRTGRKCFYLFFLRPLLWSDFLVDNLET